MAGERQPQLTGREVPDLDDAVAGTRRKPLVSRLDRNAAHPAQVPGNNAHELPRRMVRRLDRARRLVQRERLRELRGVGKSGHALLRRRVDGGYHPGRVGGRPSCDGLAHLFGARGPDWALLANEGGGELFVVFVFVVHFHRQT